MEKDYDYDLIELERHGRKLKFKVGSFEPEMGDYLVSDEGDLHRIETAGHRHTPEGKMMYIETSAEPGILKKIHPKMKFARLLSNSR